MGDEEVNDTKNIDRSVGGTLFERFFTGRNEAKRVAPRTLFMTADYVNLTAFETTDGLLLVDTGMVAAGPAVLEEIRKHTDAPLHTVVFTHGHLDHAFGLTPWLDAGARPRVIAHENVLHRFRTYMKTAPMNIHINRVQFGIEQGISWPCREEDFVWPDTTYREQLTLRLGGERFELRHAKGETDDGTWVWACDRGIVCVVTCGSASCRTAEIPRRCNATRRSGPTAWRRSLRWGRSCSCPATASRSKGQTRFAAVV
jgi:glyoxylase-like metal-dependent hydrolase (beta-lactamase superfamily II)